MEKFDFEKSLKELEKTVEDLQKGEMPLEDSIKAFENGIKLSRECTEYLENAKQKIITLTDAENEEK
ncbi:MAG: exodeoxyribonuclease VII small subunit [Clostridia bacterium]|nr:exodeoxyribonuclease VII small subunit [Clostridia bacterium]